MALVQHEDGICSCGQPKDEAWNPDMEGWLEARDDVTCAGCAALAEHGKAQKTPTPGQKVYLADTRPEGMELSAWQMPSAREQSTSDGDQDSSDTAD